MSGGGTIDPNEPTGPDEPDKQTDPSNPGGDSTQGDKVDAQGTPDTSDASVGPEVLLALALLGVAVAVVAYVLRRRS